MFTLHENCDAPRPCVLTPGWRMPGRVRRFATPLMALAVLLGPPVNAPAGEPAPPTQREGDSPSDGKDGDEKDTGKEESVVLVEGQITDYIGAGMTDVAVTMHRKAKEGAEGEIIAQATTDSFGDFKLTAPEPVHGDVVVTIAKSGFRTTTHELHLGDDEFPPFLGESLQSTLEISGRVVNALTEEPIGGAKVKVAANYRDWTATSNKKGTFKITGVAPEPGNVIVESKGFGRESKHIEDISNVEDLVIALKPERIVHLETVDELGKPIAGVTVELYDEPRDDFRTLATDADGKLTVRGLHYDATRLEVRLTHANHVSDDEFGRELTLPADKPRSAHKFVMDRAGRITGKVTDKRTAQPLSGARVMTGEGDTDRSPRAWSDYRGEYTVQGVPPGQAIVTIHRSDYAPELKTVEVKAGKETRLDVELGASTVLEGIVKNDAGEGVGGATIDAVAWRGHATLGLRAMSDHTGRFVIDNAPYDAFTIRVAARGAKRVTQTVTPGGNPVEIVLPDAPARPGPGELAAIKVGDTAPTFEATTIEGKALSLSQLKGKTVLLDFWATWCGPCIAELPDLKAVYKKFGSRDDFVMIGVSLDGDAKIHRDFIKKKNMNWHQVYGEEGGADTLADKYGVVGIPAVFLIDGDGKVTATDMRGAQIAAKVADVIDASDDSTEP